MLISKVFRLFRKDDEISDLAREAELLAKENKRKESEDL